MWACRHTKKLTTGWRILRTRCTNRFHIPSPPQRHYDSGEQRNVSLDSMCRTDHIQDRRIDKERNTKQCRPNFSKQNVRKRSKRANNGWIREISLILKKSGVRTRSDRWFELHCTCSRPSIWLGGGKQGWSSILAALIAADQSGSMTSTPMRLSLSGASSFLGDHQ
ncbi:uncharacterized protein BJX67DRAFT_358844 [Aspergillus lucknowensis]|uniref:Uncharacterized protein n=1 Tax=Aspergillus lucknowensis TaxID=176173 RepID=A0ABR4LLK3_9EURO